jgi:hypothetical protein
MDCYRCIMLYCKIVHSDYVMVVICCNRIYIYTNIVLLLIYRYLYSTCKWCIFLLCGYISLFSITIYKMSTSRNHLVVTWISYLRLHKLMGTVQARLRRVEKAADCKAWPTTALRRARTAGEVGITIPTHFFLGTLGSAIQGENQPNLEKTHGHFRGKSSTIPRI